MDAQEEAMHTPKTFPLEAGWRPMMKDLGVKPADVFRRAGLPVDLLSHLPTGLTPEQWFRLWESLEAEVDDPAFPIRLAEVVTTESFSPPIFAALCSPNLTIAAQRLRDYKRLIAPMKLDLKTSAQGLSITFQWLKTATVPPQSVFALEFTFFTRLARLATREHVVPVRVTSPRPPTPAAAYAEFLGVEPTKGRVHSMRFSNEDAERPFLTVNESMWNTFEPELRRRLSELEESTTVAGRVAAVLLESLPSGQTSIETVAHRLAFSKRTLQRRLRAEGTNFGTILAVTREKLARHYLARTAFASSEIAFLLGFEEPSSFFRAFHDWTGETPDTARRRLAPSPHRSRRTASRWGTDRLNADCSVPHRLRLRPQINRIGSSRRH
jgi:AraC-like DNA-binding protein